jgi:large subunit ribosomal protein L5
MNETPKEAPKQKQQQPAQQGQKDKQPQGQKQPQAEKQAPKKERAPLVKRTPRLLGRYREEIVPEMMKVFSYRNKLQVPHLVKIVINVGLGEATADIKLLDAAQGELAMITGQKPVVTKAKKAIANFKIRRGSSIGCKVTLRRLMMYEFLDKLIAIAIPRIRDFRGLPEDSFDRHGNYSFGLTEQVIFPEIDVDKVMKPHGMDITVVTTAKTEKEARELLRLFGMPFRKA